MRIALRLNLAASATEKFSSLEMSRGMQRTYRRVERRFSARHDSTGSAVRLVPKLRARVTVDGHDFDSEQQMPPEYRRFYEEINARSRSSLKPNTRICSSASAPSAWSRPAAPPPSFIFGCAVTTAKAAEISLRLCARGPDPNNAA